MKAKPVKAKKVNGKVVKAVKAKKEPKKKESLSHTVLKLVAETLQANSEGEFDLPSYLTRYIEPSHPKYRLGLHRESYIPSSRRVPFYQADSDEAMKIYRYQAGLVMNGFASFPIREKDFKLSYCEDCHE